MKPKLTNVQIQILKDLADYDMNVCEVARNCYYHRNTIEYHIAAIRKKTGLSPKKFYDLCKLIKLIKEETPDE